MLCSLGPGEKLALRFPGGLCCFLLAQLCPIPLCSLHRAWLGLFSVNLVPGFKCPFAVFLCCFTLNILAIDT